MNKHLGMLVVLVLVSGVLGLAQNANAGKLPANLMQFREIPQAYRAAIWNVLSPEARSTIMRETFQAVIDTGELTKEQADILRVDIARLTPELYAEHDRVNKEAQDRAQASGGKIDPERDDPFYWEDIARMVIVRRALGQYVGRLSPFQLPQLCPKACETR